MNPCEECRRSFGPHYTGRCEHGAADEGCPLNSTPHLNRARVRRTALELAAATRAQGFTRVGQSFFDRIEAATRAAIAQEVRTHPSKGKTLL